MNSLKFIERFPELSPASVTRLEIAFKKAVKKEARIMLTSGVLFDTEYTSINECQTVLLTVALCLRLDVHDVKSSSRKRPLADARKIYSYMVKHHLPDTIILSDAGALINRTHSSIINLTKEAVILKRVNKEFAEKLNRCVSAFEKAKIK